MPKLQSRTALITGGGSGIGLAIAQAFLREGAAVAIAGRDADRLRQAAEQLGSDRLIQHPCDVADVGQVETLVRSVTEQLGRIDILVNNAGVNVKQRACRDLTVEQWQHLLRINLDGAFHCIRAVLPQMRERKDGLIINISSTAGKRANPIGGSAYIASKFGLSGLGLCLAAEERDSGIRVSTIYPGEVDTPILQHRPQPVTAEQKRLILQPEDVADAVLFVATLPPRVSVPELVIKPTTQVYM